MRQQTLRLDPNGLGTVAPGRIVAPRYPRSVGRVSTVRTIEELEQQLLARDFLYDDPTAYREGVRAVTDALRTDQPVLVGADTQRHPIEVASQR